MHIKFSCKLFNGAKSEFAARKRWRNARECVELLITLVQESAKPLSWINRWSIMKEAKSGKSRSLLKLICSWHRRRPVIDRDRGHGKTGKFHHRGVDGRRTPLCPRSKRKYGKRSIIYEKDDGRHTSANSFVLKYWGGGGGVVRRQWRRIVVLPTRFECLAWETEVAASISYVAQAKSGGNGTAFNGTS